MLVNHGHTARCWQRDSNQPATRVDNATWTDDNVTGRLGGCAAAAIAVAVTIDAVVAGAVTIAGARAEGGV